MTVTAVLAREEQPSPGCEPVCRLLLSSLAMTTAEQALEVLDYYLCRWEIELFFRIFKGGCKVEKLQPEHIERLEPALALYMIIAWRVLYLMRMGAPVPGTGLRCGVR